MFKCCICGKEYATKEMAIKCILKCSRECTLSGQFHSNDSIKKPDENRIIYDNFLQEDNEEQLRSKLLESGFPKEELDKIHGYNSLFILSKLYNT